MSLSLTRKALILVAVPVLFELAITSVTLHLVTKVEQARQAEAHARELALHLNTILSLHMQRVSYAFLAQHSSQNVFEKRLERVQIEREAEARHIDELVIGHEEESAKWFRMRILFRKVESGLDDVVVSYKNDQRMLAAIKFSALQKEIDQIFLLGTELARQQSQAKDERHLALERYNNELHQALQLSLVGSVVLAFALAIYFNRGTSSRLGHIMHNAQRLAVGLSPDRTVSGGDELAMIDQVFHKTYDSLEALRRKERAILDNAADAICSIDEEFRFRDVNNAAGKLWGFKADDLVGRRVLDLFIAEEQDGIYKSLRKCLDQETELMFEARTIKADGTCAETIWVSTSSKRENSIYCVIHDVTEQRRIERLKSDFLAMVSHDLRSPLTAIQMSLAFLESQAKEMLSKDMQESIQRAHNSTQRLMALVNNLVDLDRVESGQMSIYPCLETLKDMVTTASDAVSGIATQRHIQICNLVASDVEVFADSDKIIQVLVNLLSNAFKFSPQGSKVSISAEELPQEVLIRVTDQGRGVPEEMAATIFERFKQVQRDDSKLEHGSGLGLAICKAIVERHQGRIGVEPNPEGGSIFWFSLPGHGELPE